MFGYSCNFLAHKHTAQYSGGFKTVNGRLNNTPAYNADYYSKNKHKWPEYPSQKPGKHEAPKENKGGKMGNGMPSNIPSGNSGNGNKSTLDILASMKAERDAHDAEVAAKRDSKFVAADEEGSGKGKKSGGGSGKKAKEPTEKAPKQEKAPKESKSGGGGGGKSSGEDEKKKKAEEEKKKKEEEEAKKKAEEEEKKKKADPIGNDESLSDKEKEFYKGVSNMADMSGQTIQTVVSNEGFDSLFAKYFPGDISADEKAEIKEKFMKYFKIEETLEHGWVVRRRSNEICHMGKMYKLHSDNALKHSASGIIKRGVSRSKYAGGFKMVNGRRNNTSAYNHDYYMKNRSKWAAKPTSKSSMVSDEELKQMQDEYRSWDDEKKAYVNNDPKVLEAYTNHQLAYQNWMRLADGSAHRKITDKQWAEIEKAKEQSRATNVLLAVRRSNAGKEYDEQKSKPTVSKEYQEELEYNSRTNKYR